MLQQRLALLAAEREVRRLADEVVELRSALEAQRETHARVGPLVDELPAVLWTFDPTMRCTSCFGSGLRAFNVVPAAVVGKSFDEALKLAPDTAREDAYLAALRGIDGRFTLQTSGRSYQAYVAPQRTTLGEIVGAAGIAMDVSDATDAAGALRRTEAALAQAQGIAHVGSWDNHLVTGRFVWSDEFFRLLGLEPGEVEPSLEVWRRYTHPDDDALVRAKMEHAKSTRTSYNFDRRITRTDGSVRWLQQQADFIYDESGVPIRISGTSLDITERKEAEARLAYLAHHDPLTKLPNRTLLAARLSELIAESQQRGQTFAVLFIDIDRFKTVNDTLGHAVGDTFLRVIAERLRRALRPSDTVARIGGDEFVALSGLADLAGGSQVAGRILAALAACLHLEGHDFYPSASIGISLYPSDGCTADELLRNADTAMYRAKSRGRNTFEPFARGMHTEALERLALESDLRGALERDEFFLDYQPIMDLQERVVAVEALLRWLHPTRRLVMPDRFIPIAEETGSIFALGAFVLRAACRQVQLWRSSTFPDLRLAVNVSGRQLQRRDLVSTVAAALEESRLDPRALQLEITESVIMSDVEANAQTLRELKELGVGISVDDFGTGYSSLAYLKAFPLDTIKIDKSFVRNVHAEPDDAAIVAGIVNLAHTLHLRVVAEGVETLEQVAALRSLGCDMLQGFYFARPTSSERFAERFVPPTGDEA